MAEKEESLRKAPFDFIQLFRNFNCVSTSDLTKEEMAATQASMMEVEVQTPLNGSPCKHPIIAKLQQQSKWSDIDGIPKLESATNGALYKASVPGLPKRAQMPLPQKRRVAIPLRKGLKKARSQTSFERQGSYQSTTQHVGEYKTVDDSKINYRPVAADYVPTTKKAK